MDNEFNEFSGEDKAFGDVDLGGRYLVFWMKGQLMGVSISDVRQIVSLERITVIPHSEPYIIGVMSLRDLIVPLVDIRMRLGLPEAIYDEKTCVIVVSQENVTYGMIVDAVEDVSYISDENISLPPKVCKDNAVKYMKGIGRIKDGERERMVLIADTASILGLEELRKMELELI